MENKRAFIGVNHGQDKIVIISDKPVSEFRPIEIHLKEDGALDDTPSFNFLLVNEYYPINITAQITLKMFNEGLADIGYEIVKVK